jgi:hypothetical protein
VSYPVTFEADYVEHHSRVTTFFRLILVIPLIVVLWFYEIVAFFVAIFAWFAIVITGRFPDPLYGVLAGFTRFLTRVTGYSSLLVDPYPSFDGAPDGSYPIRMDFDGPLPSYSRVKTGFRFILAIPVAVLRWAIGLLLQVAAIGAWFVIVITGRLPRGLFDVMVLASSYTARSDAYLLLLTERYPPFQDEQTRAAGLAEY